MLKTGFHRMPGYLVRRALQHHNTIFAQETEGRDVTAPQFGALRALFEFPGIDQATLADVLALDRATVGGLVERLEGKALVQRIVDPEDRRARRLYLTPRGRVLLKQLRPKLVRVTERMLEPLKPHERELLLDLLERITATEDADEESLPMAT